MKRLIIIAAAPAAACPASRSRHSPVRASSPGRICPGRDPDRQQQAQRDLVHRRQVEQLEKSVCWSRRTGSAVFGSGFRLTVPEITTRPGG